MSACRLVGLGFPGLCFRDCSWGGTNSQVAADLGSPRSLISLASSQPPFLGCLPGVGPLQNLVCDSDPHSVSRPAVSSVPWLSARPALVPAQEDWNSVTAHTASPDAERWTQGPGHYWAWPWGAPSDPSLWSSVTTLVIHLLAQFCWWLIARRTPALWVASVSQGHMCCVCTSCLALGLHQGL